MNMTRHTPGPWAINAGEPTLVYRPGRSESEDEPAIAVTYDVESAERFEWSRDTDECEANAHLIAAAPDLLDACRVALEVCRFDAGEGRKAYDLQFVRLAIESAIAKAEGAEVNSRLR